jgi:hypothetical protein
MLLRIVTGQVASRSVFLLGLHTTAVVKRIQPLGLLTVSRRDYNLCQPNHRVWERSTYRTQDTTTQSAPQERYILYVSTQL